MNAGLRQAVTVAGLGVPATAWLRYDRDPLAVGTERDSRDNGIFLKDDAPRTPARQIDEKELGPGRQMGVEFFGARSMPWSPTAAGECFAVGGVGGHRVSGFRFIRRKRSHLLAGCDVPELGRVLPFLPFLPEVLVIYLDRTA